MGRVTTEAILDFFFFDLVLILSLKLNCCKLAARESLKNII